jgi:hypothetical protein
MEESCLKIFNDPPTGENWKEVWEGEASIPLLEMLRVNFEKLGFKIYVQVILPESETPVQRIFFYKIFVSKR